MKTLSRSINECRVDFRTLIISIAKETGMYYLIKRLNRILQFTRKGI